MICCVLFSWKKSHLEPPVWTELSYFIHHILRKERVVENISGCVSLCWVHHQHPSDLRKPREEFDSLLCQCKMLITLNLFEWDELWAENHPTKSLTVSERSSHSGDEKSYFPAKIMRSISICFLCQKGGEPASSVYMITPELHLQASTGGNSTCAHCGDNSLVFVSPEPPVLCHLCTLTCPQQYHILCVLVPWSTQWSQGPGNRGSHTPLCHRHVTPVNPQYLQITYSSTIPNEMLTNGLIRHLTWLFLQLMMWHLSIFEKSESGTATCWSSEFPVVEQLRQIQTCATRPRLSVDPQQLL